MKLRRDDQVMMLAGRDKGKTGKVTMILPDQAAIVVEGLNLVKRHTKAGGKHPRGGIIQTAKDVPAGKVGLVCPNCHKVTRIGYVISGDNKERICRKCQATVKS